MKRFSIFCAALFVAATSFAAVTYELNGAVTNDYGWMSKDDMYHAILVDMNAITPTTKVDVDTVTLAYSKTQAVNLGIPTWFGSLDAILDNADFMAKWGWLITYMDAVCVEQRKDGAKPSNKGAYLRYNLAAFFIDQTPGAWNYGDYGAAGQVAAFQPTWKHGFDNPTNPTGSFELNAPYLEGETFRGWYNNPEGNGEPITHVDENTTVTLYAIFGEYVYNIKEVRGMEVGTEVQVKGVVNHVGGNTIYIQDATNLGMDVYLKNSGVTVGKEVTFAGTITNAKGWPRLEATEVVDTKEGKLFDPTTINLLSELVNDTLFNHYAKRVAISGLTIAKYDDNGDVYFTDGTDTVQGYYMKLDQTTFPVGKVVNINGAVAAWYGENFQFTGDVASVSLAPKGAVDTYAYPTRHEKYNLKNDWIYSVQDGNYKGNEPGANDMVRGMVARDGKMYFADRGTASIIVVDGATGEKLAPIPVKGENLFKKQGDDGVWSDGCQYAYNDIKMDNAGNCLIGACLVSINQNFYIYTVDLETGEATELINECLLDNPDFAAAGIDLRFDAFGVSGDVKGNACIMAADSKDGWRVYRWLIKEGVAGKAEMITVKPTADNSLFASSAGFGTAPQVFPQDENGDYFYVDGSNILPMLCDGAGSVIEDFKFCPTGRQVWNNEGDTINMTNAQPNGVCEFEVNGEYFMAMVAEYSTGTVSTKFALFKFDNEYRSFMEMEPLWYFPAKGMGSDQYQGRSAVPYVDVVGNTAHIYLYATNNGYAAYTFTVGETSAVEDVEVIKIGAKKVIENGQVFIIKNGIKYNTLGAEVK